MRINSMDNPTHRDPPPGSKRTFRSNIINNNNNNNNKSSSRHASMSDNESTISQADSWHTASPSPFQIDDTTPNDPHFPTTNNAAKALIVSPDLSYSPVPSPGKPNFPATAPPSVGLRPGRPPWPRSEKLDNYPASEGGNGGREKKSALESSYDSYAGIASAPAPALGFNRLSREAQEGSMHVTKVVADGGGARGVRLEEGEMVLSLRRQASSTASFSRAGVRKAAVVFRVFGMAACLISFSVMAADKTKGWAGDSYDRYIEYRYCLGVNIIGFVYAGFQALGLACQMGSGNSGEDLQERNWFCLQFDFSMDQILAYLLLSASSCGATRVTDWMFNWGKDDFTFMATVSIAMSFLAFIAFAVSSVISAYHLFYRDDS